MDLVELTRTRSGVDSDEIAAHALASVVALLRAVLPESDCAALSRALPELGGHAAPAVVVTLEELYDRVAVRTSTPRALAMELTQVVLEVLSERLDHALLTRMRKHLPPSIAAHLAPRASSTAPERMRVAPAVAPVEVDTLATGRVGSKHPVSTSRSERAHARSVARSAAPGGDTKLSSARGLTQQREHESLADANREPGPRRPLSG